MSSAFRALGTLLKIGDGGGPEVFTTVAEMLDFAGPEESNDIKDVTNHDSTNRYEEAIATVIRTGNITGQINYLPDHATHDSTTGLRAFLRDGNTHNIQIVLQNAAATTYSMAVLVNLLSPSYNIGDQVMADISMKVTGEVTVS